MTTVRRVTERCNRCTFNNAKPATETRSFALGDQWFKVPLCPEHAVIFDRDLGRWTMIADEADAPATAKSEYFTAERKRETQRITELRAKAANKIASENFAQRRRAELDAEKERTDQQEAEQLARWSIPGAMNWQLTEHARERMVEREFTIFEVLQAAALPETTYKQIWGGEHDKEIYQRGDCRVAVNPVTKEIITVIDRSTTLQTNQPANGTHQEAQVAR